MALVECRECGAQVSDSATTCPSCGIKGPADERTVKKPTGCLGWTLIVVCGLFIVGIVVSQSPEEQARMRADEAKRCASTPAQREAAIGLIQLNGYRCNVVKQICFYDNLGEYLVSCERYMFTLTDHGGKWSVTPEGG